MASTAVTGFTEPYKNSHPYYRGTYYAVVSRTATGSGNGTSGVAYAAGQQRLGQLTDFSFPYRYGGRYYLGVRAVIIVTATASGQGTAGSVSYVLRQRQGSASGTSSQSATRKVVSLRTASGTGSSSFDAFGLRIVLRTATGSGSGTSSANWNVNPARTATGSGVGSSASVGTRVVLRTSNSPGSSGSSASRLLVALRTATGPANGSQTAIGARIRRVSASSTGQGAATAAWLKSHIFRVPYTDTYPGGYFGGGNSANRLRRYDRSNVRGLNLYKLTDGSYTTVEQRDQGQVAKLWHGGRNHFLTDDEVAELTAAGYGDYIT